jgi:hypothetical protein
MPTGSYDSSVVSTFILATQPLSLSNGSVNEIQLSYQPITFWSNNYLATYPILPIVFSPVIISPSNYPTVVISSADTISPNVFIIRQ